jgi:exopolyphosphatase/guanosine-5'-triphosphate,3'-diphosphate pyrophosphatase
VNRRTAVIDIGSNSARVVIFEQSSRYGFHLICEEKSKVRIGEGAYAKGGYLQPIGIKRAYLALKSFQCIIAKYQVTQTFCVATSALRDAPNGAIFTQWIEENLGLKIEIIDGKKEAYYGGIAVANLLPVEEGVTIDIGGGSSDISLLKEGKIVDSYSLNLGTVRLKELFFDQTAPHSIEHAAAYIQKELKRLPKAFHHTRAIGIGGTARALSKAIMRRSNYPFEKLHAFTYEIKTHQKYLDQLPHAPIHALKKLGIKKNRYDTIREGTLIFNHITDHIGANEVITSAVGVREGLFLHHFLKGKSDRFPKTSNPSIISLLDRFKVVIEIEKKRKMKGRISQRLYQLFQPQMHDRMRYSYELEQALKLSSIGKALTIYKANQHAFYIAMQELNFALRHEQIILIASLLRQHNKENLQKEFYQRYQTLLPPKKLLAWLNFIYSLTVLLHEASNTAQIGFSFDNNILNIYADRPLYLAKEAIGLLERPSSFSILFHDEQQLPKNSQLNI